MQDTTKVKVKDEPFLERDVFSSAILNRDTSAYAATIRRKRNKKSQDRLIAELREKIQELLDWKEEITLLLSKKEDK